MLAVGKRCRLVTAVRPVSAFSRTVENGSCTITLDLRESCSNAVSSSR
jgi:hypothetical protein